MVSEKLLYTKYVGYVLSFFPLSILTSTLIIVSGTITVAFVSGLVGFVWLLFPATAPDLYNYRTDNCHCWQGYCTWNQFCEFFTRYKVIVAEKCRGNCRTIVSDLFQIVKLIMYKLRTLSFPVFCYSYLLTSIEPHILGIKKQIILLSKTLTWYSSLYILTLHFLFFVFTCKQILRMVERHFI